MLDFYLIKDSTSISNHGAHVIDFLGGINDSDFEHLQNINVIESHLDYYKDFRWSNEQVLRKNAQLNTISSLNDAERKMLDILNKAKETNNGLIAYCD